MRLVWAAAAWPHVAEKQLYPLAELYPKAIIMAGPDALAELFEIHPSPPERVWRTLEQAANECSLDDNAGWQAAMDELQERANREGPSSGPGPLSS
jgi:hypothetical protein